MEGYSPLHGDPALLVDGPDDRVEREHFRGRIDEVIVFGQAPSARDVEQLYRAQDQR